MATPEIASTIETPKVPPLTALRILTRVWRFVRPYRRQVIFAGIALVFAAGAVLMIGQGLKFVIDRGFSAGSAPELDRALIFMLGVVVVVAFATYARFYFVSWIGERVTADLRRAVFDHLLSLPPGYFEVMRTGEVISRLTNDTTMLETVIGSSASVAIRNVLLMIGGLVMLALTSGKLTLLVLVGVASLIICEQILTGWLALGERANILRSNLNLIEWAAVLVLITCRTGAIAGLDVLRRRGA